jgi:hypothetical protein
MTQIKPLSEPEEFIDKDHEYMKTFTLWQDAFMDDEGGSGLKTPVNLMWGGKDLNKDEVPGWNVSYKGNTTFDAAFASNFHIESNQLFMKNKCDELKTVKGVATRVDADKRDTTVMCWTDIFITRYLPRKLLEDSQVREGTTTA